MRSVNPAKETRREMLVNLFRNLRRRLGQPWIYSIPFLAFVICSAPVSAHEIGTSRVSVLFQERQSYDIEIVTDASALIDKLKAASGQASSAPGRDSMQGLLQNFDDEFRQRVKVAFDGVEVHPAIAYSVTPGTGSTSASVAAIRLTGQIPPGAQNFTWTYAWTFASYGMTMRNAASDHPLTQWLEGGQRSAPFVLAAPAAVVGRLTVSRRYFSLGFTHIVPLGLDHMLFVLGIFLLSGRVRSVLLQVSAFTVAHSITLGLTMYGLVTVSPRIVEPLIAISIAYIAIENIFLSELKSWRVALVFAFGLMHGMGFAGALKELGLPRSEFVTALLTFNLGVEAGQLAVIGAGFLLVGWHCANRPWYRSRIVVPASMIIACTAVYWTIVRLGL
jgi:hydrogenase/urease accessory protein HupE